MIRAEELAIPAPATSPAPYYRRRLAELVAQGLAKPREPKKRVYRNETWRRKAARIFEVTLRRMGTATAYWIPGEKRVAYRKSGAAFRIVLPPDAVLIGVYTGTAGTDRFLDDLVATMRAGA